MPLSPQRRRHTPHNAAATHPTPLPATTHSPTLTKT